MRAEVNLHRRSVLRTHDSSEAIGVVRNACADFKDDNWLLCGGFEGTGFKVAPLGPRMSHGSSIILPMERKAQCALSGALLDRRLPHISPSNVKVAEHLPKHRQRQPDHVVMVTLDARHKWSTKTIDGEGARHL